jgi:hypothetical protein
MTEKNNMLEIIEYKTSKKAPLFLELPVPPRTFPYLVGNPKEDQGLLLSWAEKPSKNNTVLSWGVEKSIEEIISDLKKITSLRNKTSKWGLNHIYLKDAVQFLKSQGIEEIMRQGNTISPKDPSLLGSIIIIKNKKFPLIHNVSRGLCFFERD